MAEENHYDVIMIGSGIGALTAASVLAKLKRKRTLLLEQHTVAGGFTHEFKRPGNLTWDVGIHYIGEMGEGRDPRAIMDFISDGGIQWTRMNEPFERFVYPDFTFELYGEPARFKKDLIGRFPDEEPAIAQYFRDIKKAVGWGRRRFVGDTLPFPLRDLMLGPGGAGKKLALMLTKDYLDERFRDPKLKATLVSQWKDHGMPPDRSAFLSHAIIVDHYLRGGYYPVGGAHAIASNIMPVIEKRGGKCLTRHRVTRVLVENGAAKGVEVVHRKGGRDLTESYFAPVVISGAGAHTTYAKLIPREIAAPYLDRLNTLLPGNSAVSLYVSFKESPERLGFRGENYWIADSYDHDGDMESESVLSGNPVACYLSFPSLKDPKASIHTAEIVAITDYGAFKRWADRPWMDRGEEYDALKDRIAAGLLRLVERKFPGFSDLVEYQEVSTPLSVEHFMQSPEGAIYGLAGTPERFRQKWLGVRTPVNNLYLAGSDVYFHGLVGATMGGLAAASAAMGPFGFFRIMTAITLAARRRL